MPWYAWGFFANVCFTVNEYIARRDASSSWLAVAPYALPLVIAGNAGVFYAWRDAPSLMTAWGSFFVGSVVLRLLSSHYAVGEPLTPTAWLGVLLIAAGATLVRLGTR